MNDKPKYTMVSLEDGNDIKDRLKVLSIQTRTPIGVLVRQAIDEQYGSYLEKILENLSIPVDIRPTKNASDE